MTHTRISPLIALLSFALLGGCATMSPEECQRANWQDIGLRDGLDGEPMSTLDDRMKDCRKAGFAVDTGRYVIGREQGLQTYCKLENALPLGLSGNSYHGVCPPMVDIEFRRLYDAGRVVYQLRSEAARLDERTESLERQLRATSYEEDKRLREADKDDDRKRIRKEFDDRRRRIRDDLSDTDRRLRRVRDELRSAEFGLRTLQ